MTSDIRSKFITYIETLENTVLTKIASGEMAIEYDPDAIEFQTANYSEDNWRNVESGDVSGCASELRRTLEKGFGVREL